MTWLNQFEDRANLNGSNGVNNEDIKQMAIWSGFDEERAKFDIRLAYLYRFARSSLEHEAANPHKENT
jgi:hypothetical protein